MCEINPDYTKEKDRILLRNLICTEKFDPDHYLADFDETEEIEYLISRKLTLLSCKSMTNDEQFILKNLPNKEFLINDKLKCFN